MKASFVVVLMAVVCMEQVHSLVCYQCENEPSNWNCRRKIVCAESDKYCLTTTWTSLLPGNSGYRINKGCSRICEDPKVNYSLPDASTKCCNTFLCNFSGATSVKTSTVLTAVGILASFLCIFRS